MMTSPDRMHAETGEDGCLRLRLVGEIDMTFTVEHHAALEAIVANPPRRLELDAADLTFIDSTGLRAFATLATCVRANGGEVRTIESSEAFGRIVAVTGLGERFGLITASRGADPGPHDEVGRSV